MLKQIGTPKLPETRVGVPVQQSVQDGKLLTQCAQKMLANGYNTTERNIDAALEKSFGRPLSVKTHGLFGDGENREVIDDAIRPRGLTQEQIDRAVRTLDLAMAPASYQDITMFLGKLRAVTKHRREGDVDLEMRIEVYSGKLRDYPADVVAEVLDQAWGWFPDWLELKLELDSLAHKRRRLREIIGRWRPWSRQDEIDYLKRIDEKARFNAKHYGNKEPELAEKYRVKARNARIRLSELGVCDHPDVAKRKLEKALAEYHASRERTEGNDDDGQDGQERQHEDRPADHADA